MRISTKTSAWGNFRVCVHRGGHIWKLRKPQEIKSMRKETNQLFAHLDILVGHVEAALLRNVEAIKVGGAHAQPLYVRRRQVTAVVRHVHAACVNRLSVGSGVLRSDIPHHSWRACLTNLTLTSHVGCCTGCSHLSEESAHVVR